MRLPTVRGCTLSTRAVQMLPDNAMLLNTLAVAQFRCGDHAEALATFRKIEALEQAGQREISIIDLVIGTLSAEAVHDPQASDVRARLVAACAKPGALSNAEIRAFAAEAGIKP